ncbi:MAG: glycosyl hydrolase, partial [Duncaniella sp.]|nr:glycosyl hydrolase [Duncaniella sp.]
AQPLLHVTSDRHKEVIAPVAVDNENVYVTIVKSTDLDNEMIVRLRSLSPRNEQVNLTFPQRTPSAVNLCTLEEKPSDSVDGTLTMLPYGMATIRVRF